MPATYHLDGDLQIVRSRAWGILTDDESTAHYSKLAADPEFKSTYSQVCDLRDVERIDMSTAAIRNIAAKSVFDVGVRRAFVAPADAHFGLSRMLQTFCEIEGTQIGVFRTMAEAEEWMQLEPGSL